MLPKENRLPARKIKKVLDLGRWLKSPLLSLVILEDKKTEEARIVVIVPTKVEKKAAARNRIRRQIREVLRKKTFHFKKGKAIIVMVNPGALKKSSKKLEEMIEEMFKKGDLIDQSS